MKRLKKIFSEMKPLIVYITAGYPTLHQSEQIIKDMIDAGVRVFEVGVPFSDPTADGEVIQRAMQSSLAQGVNLDKTLELIARLRKYAPDVAFLLMSYATPIYHFGYQKMIEELKHIDCDGVIIPDLPFDEAKPFYRALKRAGKVGVQFITPLTPLSRVERIAHSASGFLYVISHPGTTGSSIGSGRELRDFLKSVREITSLPLCVGFGIKRKADVKGLWDLIDGYIVGTEIIRAIDEGRLNKTLEALL